MSGMADEQTNDLREIADKQNCKNFTIRENVMLKPCPFCGHQSCYAIFLSQLKPFALYCPECGILGSVGNSREEAIAKWHRRKDEEMVEYDLK